eukprot:3047233-Pyramimonas_sp.AAC.1
MPATDVQRVTRAAYKDGLHHSEIVKLARMGQWGNYPGNIHKQLSTLLGKNNLPIPLEVEAPCLGPKSNRLTEGPCAILLPREWFSSLYFNYESESSGPALAGPALLYAGRRRKRRRRRRGRRRRRRRRGG